MIYLIIGRRELGKTTLARYVAHAKSPRLILDPRAQWPVTSTVYRRIESEPMMEDLDAGRDVLVQPLDLQVSADACAPLANLYFQEDHDDTRELSIVLDEAALYDLGAWDWMMRCSPRMRTAIILTAHRPKDISTSIRALTDIWCIFRTTQAHDLDAIEERCGALVTRHVQTLEPFEFVEWDDAKAQMTIHRNAAAWFTPDARRLEGEPVTERRVRHLWE
jgi:hypothetical protein